MEDYKIKFKNYDILPKDAKPEDEPIFRLCNNKKKSLLIPEERALISLLNAFSEWELRVNTVDWTYRVFPLITKAEKIRTINDKKLIDKPTGSWITFEILNYLQILHEMKFNYLTSKNPIAQHFKEIYFLQQNLKGDYDIIMSTKEHMSWPKDFAFALIEHLIPEDKA